MKVENFAGTLVTKGKKILLVQEKHKEALGLWSLPLGKVDMGEEIEQAAVRETLEETGFFVKTIENKNYLIIGKDFKSLKKFNNKMIKLNIYKSKIDSGKLKKGDDVLDVKFFNIKEIQNLKLRGSWIIYILKDFLIL
ncbi:MAG: 8-oxo-dGTP diphosphatase [Patescibacteria group bacterium]|nr:8-oxo-dGTP diphosphatase [Patescibacteria group bacterium]